jgi:hypothetical protein
MARSNRTTPAHTPEIIYDHDHPAIAGAYETPDMAGQIDTLGDRLLDVAKSPVLVAALVEAEVHARMGSMLCETINRVLIYIVDSRHPRMKADIAALAAGLRIRDGWQPVTLAKKYGISRTRACAEIRKFCDMTGIPPQIQLHVATKNLGKTHKKTNRRNYKHEL